MEPSSYSNPSIDGQSPKEKVGRLDNVSATASSSKNSVSVDKSQADASSAPELSTEGQSGKNDEGSVHDFDDSVVASSSNTTSSLATAKGKSTLASTVSRNRKESPDDVRGHDCNEVQVSVRVCLIRRGHSYGAWRSC